MNYNKLYDFYVVAQKGSFTHAAQVLHITQPSLSKAVKDLEQELGVTLFQRVGRTLSLTPAGAVLYGECEGFFSREAEMIRAVQGYAGDRAALIRFGYMTFDLIYQIPDFIRRFRRQHTDLMVSASSYLERVAINEDLLSGRLDVGLKLFTTDEIIPELGFQVLGEHHLSIICCDSHPLSRRSYVDLHELAQEEFVFLGLDERSSEYRFAMDWCGRCGFTPRICAKFERVESVLTMVQSNAGIALLSDFAPIRYMRNLVSVPLNNAPMVYSGLFWRRNDLNPELKRFVNAFLGEIEPEHPRLPFPESGDSVPNS